MTRNTAETPPRKRAFDWASSYNFWSILKIIDFVRRDGVGDLDAGAAMTSSLSRPYIRA